jgi:mono/diheme cytochrome c family protein
MANIIVHGLAGEIVVQGKTYNGAMPAQGALLSDYEIAAAATYVRGSWGNDDGMVLPDVVKAAR